MIRLLLEKLLRPKPLRQSEELDQIIQEGKETLEQRWQAAERFLRDVKGRTWK
jgi:hypothetical protein